MALPFPPRLRSEFCALALLILVQLVAFIWARTTGFLAISDDDYARVVISQNFAASPTWDPSGTSWLPFPFLHLGTAMRLFSPSLEFARTWAFVSACTATFLIYAAARRWRVRVSLAFAAAAGGALLPYSVYLSAATVPEYLTAALVVFGLATLARPASDNRSSVLGGVCLLLATASRYEAWPVALAFAGLKTWDAKRLGSPGALLSVGLALFFPIVWLVHGLVDHGNALFFVKRVVEYKNALGGDTSGVIATLAYAKALLLAEPEATFVTAGLIVLVATKRSAVTEYGGWVRAWLPLVVMSLVVGLSALRGGAPTHHEERALLPIWLFSVLTSAGLIEHAQLRWKEAALLVLLGLGVGLATRGCALFEREGFTDRRQEEALGKRLRELAGAETRLGLQLDDYGYFAVMASAGHPHRFEIFDTHDPRARSVAASPMDRYRSEGGCLFVVPGAHQSSTAEVEIEKFSHWSIRKFRDCSFSATEHSTR